MYVNMKIYNINCYHLFTNIIYLNLFNEIFVKTKKFVNKNSYIL